MIAGDWDPEELPPAPVDAPVDLSAIRAELEAAGTVDRDAARELRNVSEEERERAIVNAAVARANLAAQAAAVGRPMTPDELTQDRAIVEAERVRLGLSTMAETLDMIDPLGVPRGTGPAPFPEPEDRGTATLSALGGVEYVDDIIRPGRIVVVAA